MTSCNIIGCSDEATWKIYPVGVRDASAFFRCDEHIDHHGRDEVIKTRVGDNRDPQFAAFLGGYRSAASRQHRPDGFDSQEAFVERLFEEWKMDNNKYDSLAQQLEAELQSAQRLLDAGLTDDLVTTLEQALDHAKELDEL